MTVAKSVYVALGMLFRGAAILGALGGVMVFSWGLFSEGRNLSTEGFLMLLLLFTETMLAAVLLWLAAKAALARGTG